MKLYTLFNDIALSNFLPIRRLQWVGHIRIEKGTIPRRTLEEDEDWLEDHEINGKIWYKELQQTCSLYGTRGRRQGIGKIGKEELGRQQPENGPKSHR